MQYYKLNEIYVEYDSFRNIFRHWNPINRIGKKDKVSEWVVSKLINEVLIPIHESKFREMFDHCVWLKIPPIEYITIEGRIELSNDN